MKTLFILSFLASATALVIYGHPWWAGLMLWLAVVIALDKPLPPPSIP